MGDQQVFPLGIRVDLGIAERAQPGFTRAVHPIGVNGHLDLRRAVAIKLGNIAHHGHKIEIRFIGGDAEFEQIGLLVADPVCAVIVGVVPPNILALVAGIAANVPQVHLARRGHGPVGSIGIDGDRMGEDRRIQGEK